MDRSLICWRLIRPGTWRCIAAAHPLKCDVLLRHIPWNVPFCCCGTSPEMWRVAAAHPLECAVLLLRHIPWNVALFCCGISPGRWRCVAVAQPLECDILLLRHIPDDLSFQQHLLEGLTPRTVWMWTMTSADNLKLQPLHFLSNDWVEALFWRRPWYLLHYDYKLRANRVSISVLLSSGVRHCAVR